MTGRAADGAGTRSVLVVCTGNICRSPAAELLLRARLAELGQHGVRVASAGTGARVGEPVAEPVAELLRAQDVDPDGFAARQLVPALVVGADLVLTMTGAQRSAVVAANPAALRRTFTLREFAGLAALVGPTVVDPAQPPADRLAALVAAAPRGRGRRDAGPVHDDVPDPHRGPAEGYATATGLVATAVDELVAVLAGAPAGNRSPDRADPAGTFG